MIREKLVPRCCLALGMSAGMFLLQPRIVQNYRCEAAVDTPPRRSSGCDSCGEPFRFLFSSRTILVKPRSRDWSVVHRVCELFTVYQIVGLRGAGPGTRRVRHALESDSKKSRATGHCVRD